MRLDESVDQELLHFGEDCCAASHCHSSRRRTAELAILNGFKKKVGMKHY